MNDNMFLDNLSTAVIRICDQLNLSHEAASARCDLSSRYFGDIVRGNTAPTIKTLEKLCIGFGITPNDLLISASSKGSSKGSGIQKPMPVTQILSLPSSSGFSGFPICPNCSITLEREYQNFCDRCGQRLDWRRYSSASIVKAGEQFASCKQRT